MQQERDFDRSSGALVVHGSILPNLDSSAIVPYGSIRYARDMPASDSVVAAYERKWPTWTLRISLTVTALLLFGQALLAGLFLQGVHGAFAVHREMATVSGIALMISIVATVLSRRFAGTARWPIWAAVGLLALMSLQAFAGFRSLPALHIPLGGVLVIGLDAALTGGWAWRSPQSGSRVSAHVARDAEAERVRPGDEPHQHRDEREAHDRSEPHPALELGEFARPPDPHDHEHDGGKVRSTDENQRNDGDEVHAANVSQPKSRREGSAG